MGYYSETGITCNLISLIVLTYKYNQIWYVVDKLIFFHLVNYSFECVCVCVCVCVCGGVAAVYFTCLARGGVPLSAQPGSISLTMLRRNFWGRGTDLEPETAKLNVKLNPVLLQGYSIEERLICISRRSFPMGIFIKWIISTLSKHCGLETYTETCVLAHQQEQLNVFTVSQLRAYRSLPPAT